MLRQIFENIDNLEDIVMDFVGASTDQDKKEAMRTAEKLYKWISSRYKRSDIGVKIVDNSSKDKIDVKFL